jgi:hypothetical protein
MQKRSAIRLSIVAASLLAVMLWQLLPSRPAAQSQASEPTAGATEPHADTRLTPTPTIENERIALAPEENPNVARNESASSAAEALLSLLRPHDVSDATLVVHPVAQTTTKPLSDVRVRVEKKVSEGMSFSVFVDARKGSLGSVPITAKDGEVEFDLPSGCDFEVTATGEKDDVGTSTTVVTSLQKGERRTVTIELQVGKDMQFHGRILSREDHAPVSGAKVIVIQGNSDPSSSDEDHDQPEPVSLDESRSDIDGRFEVAAASWVDACVRVDAKGFGLALVPISADHASTDTERTVLLDRGGDVNARVIDAEGAAMAGVKVVATVDGYGLLRDQDIDAASPNLITRARWSATTGVDGRCVLSDLTPGAPFRVLLRRDDKVLQRVGEMPALEPGETRHVEWQIGGGYVLKGVVAYASGKVVPDQELWLLHARRKEPRLLTVFDEPNAVQKTTTNAHGEFTLQGLTAGLWWVGPHQSIASFDSSETDELIPLAQIVEIVPAEREKKIVLTMPDALFIRGRAVDSEGSPAAGAELRALSEDSLVVATESEADGRFALGPLSPGAVLVEANLTKPSVEHACITAAAGARDVLVKLQPPASIAGIVLDTASGSGCHSELLLSPHPGTVEPLKFIRVDMGGSFEERSLGQGTYDLTAWTSDGRIVVLSDLQIGPGARVQGLILKLEHCAKLRIRYDGMTAFGIVKIQRAGVVVVQSSIGRHRPLIQPVPSGLLTIQVWAGFAKPLSREVEIAVGEEKEVVFNDDS